MSDVWGVVHNGLMAFAGAAEALGHFRVGGGKVVLMTNSPNPTRIVEAQLARLGVMRKAYDAIVSSGDVTVSVLVERADAGMGQTAAANYVPRRVPKSPHDKRFFRRFDESGYSLN